MTTVAPFLNFISTLVWSSCSHGPTQLRVYTAASAVDVLLHLPISVSSPQLESRGLLRHRCAFLLRASSSYVSKHSELQYCVFNTISPSARLGPAVVPSFASEQALRQAQRANIIQHRHSTDPLLCALCDWRFWLRFSP